MVGKCLNFIDSNFAEIGQFRFLILSFDASSVKREGNVWMFQYKNVYILLLL